MPATRSTLTTLSEGLAQAIHRDQIQAGPGAFAGVFGTHVAHWLRAVAAQVDGVRQAHEASTAHPARQVEPDVLYATAPTIYDGEAGRFNAGPCPFNPSWMAGDDLIFALAADGPGYADYQVEKELKVAPIRALLKEALGEASETGVVQHSARPDEAEPRMRA